MLSPAVCVDLSARALTLYGRVSYALKIDFQIILSLLVFISNTDFTQYKKSKWIACKHECNIFSLVLNIVFWDIGVSTVHIDASLASIYKASWKTYWFLLRGTVPLTFPIWRTHGRLQYVYSSIGLTTCSYWHLLWTISFIICEFFLVTCMSLFTLIVLVVTLLQQTCDLFLAGRIFTVLKALESTERPN